MSGICGIALRDRDHWLNANDLLPMVQALDVLGEGRGFPALCGSVGLGAHSFPGRLAGVAKLAVHSQPLVLAFHGNLYNLQELLPIVQENSNPFIAILQLYVKEGMMFLQRLRGEFALALWDGLAETLYLATDRFRVHPLFYYQDPHKLVFASRMQGILACPFHIKRTVNPEAVVDVVASSIIPTPRTIFREVKKLPPGYLLTCHKGEIRLASYWEIDFLQADGVGEAKLARTLKAHLTDAASIRLERDVVSDRIGTFLSGGIDSSTVTGVLTQLANRPIKSFSIGFDESRFNEINYARIAARAFGAKHYEYFVTPQDTYDAIPVLLEAFDEPFANASAIPTYFCARIAREQGVDVLYAGDGGDELFAGNERYAIQRLFEYYHKIPAWLREPVVKPLLFGLADRLSWEFFIKGKKYIQRASIPYPERLFSYGFFKSVPMTEFLEAAFVDTLGMGYDTYGPISVYYHQAPARTDLDKQLYIDLKLAISDNDLFKVTRMTEAAGVAVRFPFLDHRLAEFAASIPANIKMRRRQLRSFFKKTYADLLPSEIRTKKKHGFGLPIPVWLRTDRQLNEMMHDLILSRRSIQRGYFQEKALEQLVEYHTTDETSFYGTVLWNLMILELWHRTCLERNSPRPRLSEK
jgi:asparagine synthase (glutamine-hydrolysing)